MNKILQLLNKYSEIISYLFWGVLTTVVCWGSYSLFMLIIKDALPTETYAVALANAFSWLCAVIFSFITNKIFVFKSKSWKKESLIPEAGKFVSSRLATGILEIVSVPALVAIGLNQSLFGIDGMLAKIIVSILMVIVNYIFCKIFIFHRKKSDNTEE